jgi:hypothetical protein
MADVVLTPRGAAPSPLLRAIAPFGAPVSGGGARFATRYTWRGVAAFAPR